MIDIFLYKIEFYYMCVKLPPRDLKSGPYPSHSTNIYTCEMTIASKVCSGIMIVTNRHLL